MKKIIFFFVSLAIIAGLYSTDVNVAAGLTFPRINNEDGTMGFNFSASIDKNMRDAIIIEPGVRIRQMRQYDKTELSSSAKTEITCSMYYLDLFARAKFDLMKDAKSEMKLLPFVGLGMGIYMSGETVVKSTYSGSTNEQTYNLDDEVSAIVWGLSLGIELPINSKYAIIAEYNKALNSLLKDYTSRSSTLMLNISYLFQF